MTKKVLVFSNYYYPSVKAGGPVQSIKNLVDNMHEKLDFSIVTANRDLGDESPFKRVPLEKWTVVKNARVFYSEVNILLINKLLKFVKSSNYDIIYLNSFFSFYFSISPVILNKFFNNKSKKTIIAPRGEFSPGAIKLKKWKKILYIRLSTILKLHDNVIWHATSVEESENIKTYFGDDSEIVIANNLTGNYLNNKYQKNINKTPGNLKVVFISRIHPKKNLLYAINIISKLTGDIEFSIYGPIEDNKYWKKCIELINTLPKNISVQYKGVLSHDEIFEAFHENHVMLFPTLGENYGHVISEALIGGCPVITSDQTPWRNLSKKNVGNDIDLNNSDEYIRTLNFYINSNQDIYDLHSKKAFYYAIRESNSDLDLENYYKLFIGN